MDNKQIHLLPSNDAHSDAANDLRQPGSHLTDAQFTDLLLGTIPHAVTAHLEACPQCAEESQRVSGAIGSFAQQSQLWAERRASARPMLQPARQPLLSWLDRPAAWSAAAATLVLAVVVGVGAGIAHRSNHTAALEQAAQTPVQTPLQSPLQPQVSPIQPPVQVASVQPPAQASTATLKADNDLLSAIDGELSADAAPPASMYGLTVGTHLSRAKSTKRISN